MRLSHSQLHRFPVCGLWRVNFFKLQFSDLIQSEGDNRVHQRTAVIREITVHAWHSASHTDVQYMLGINTHACQHLLGLLLYQACLFTTDLFSLYPAGPWGRAAGPGSNCDWLSGLSWEGWQWAECWEGAGPLGAKHHKRGEEQEQRPSGREQRGPCAGAPGWRTGCRAFGRSAATGSCLVERLDIFSRSALHRQKILKPVSNMAQTGNTSIKMGHISKYTPLLKK